MDAIGKIVRCWGAWRLSLVLAGFGIGAAMAQQEASWEIVKIGEAEHVSIESV